MSPKTPKTPFSTRLSGSAKETELRLRSIFQWKKQRPPIWLLALVMLLAVGCGGLVSCQGEEAAPASPNTPTEETPAQVTPEPPAEEQEVRIKEDKLTGLTLDEIGEGDDSVLIQSRIPADYRDCETTMWVTLGNDAGVLTRTWKEQVFPKLLYGRLTDLKRDSIVVELGDITSNYLAAYTYVLDVVDGQLVERLHYDGEQGASIQPHHDGTLDTLHLAQLVAKWHQPEFCPAVWDGEKFSVIGSGFFTDTIELSSDYYDADNTPMELTLSLRGITTEDDLVYDQVQIMKGDEVWQSIDPAPYLPDRYYDYSGFLAYGFTTYGAVDVRDINFDGHPDFGLLCDNTRNERHAWFIWNTSEHKFTYFAHLGGELTIDDTVWQLQEVVWDENFDNQITNRYSVSYTGKLIPLLSHAKEETAKFADAAEAFQAVLLRRNPAYDAADGSERYFERRLSDSALHAGYFSVVDLDRDGMPEVVLWMAIGANKYYGFDILRYEDGKAVYYSQVYRGLQGLKEDGTFSFSSGAFDHGFGRIRTFGTEGYETEQITWRQNGNFYVDGRNSNSAKFDAALARQDEKPDVAWYETTEENIDNIGLIMAAAGKK